jgi:hypothetical protein
MSGYSFQILIFVLEFLPQEDFDLFQIASYELIEPVHPRHSCMKIQSSFAETGPA